MREQVIESIKTEQIVVIVRGLRPETLIPFAEAVYAGGIRLLEITFNAADPKEDEVTAANIKALSEHFAGRMLIGAGTVLNTRQVGLTAAAGGKFIISPDTNPEVIKKTRELGLVSMPGALTPTEIQAAHLAGADFVKLFPITSLGPDYVKAVKAPLSHIKLLAVGGVDETNMATYKKAGVSGFGIGSNIVNKALIEAGNWPAVTELARKYTQALK